MADIEKLIPKYLEILQGKRKPRFKQNGSLLRCKIEQAFKMLGSCNLCERNCRADRLSGELGYCRVGAKMSVGGHGIGHNDLPLFCPSYDIFFLGCSLRCVFCQNWETSQVAEPAVKISEEKLAATIDSRSRFKAIDFVGGDPAPQLPFVLKILSHLNKDAPVIWHSGFYMSQEAMELLQGIVDLYCTTVKYGNDACARRLSKVTRYTEVIHRNIMEAHKDAEIVLRHLVMPNHLECCAKPVLNFIADAFGDKVLVHIMDQYEPYWKAKNYPDIGKKTTKREFYAAVYYADKLGVNYIIEE